VSIEEILKKFRVIAIVGFSRDPSKDSNRVATYMKHEGFTIIPVNPSTSEILGERCYPSLTAMPEELQRRVEIVNIFRPSQQVSTIVDEAIKMRKRWGNPSVVWTQLGIVDYEATARAESTGLAVVMDRCILIEHQRVKWMIDPQSKYEK
jgi:predicted CoA-binding protein